MLHCLAIGLEINQSFHTVCFVIVKYIRLAIMAGFFCSIRNPSFFPLAPVKRVLFLQAMALYLATLRGLGTVEFRLRLKAVSRPESHFFSPGKAI